LGVKLILRAFIR